MTNLLPNLFMFGEILTAKKHSPFQLQRILITAHIKLIHSNVTSFPSPIKNKKITQPLAPTSKPLKNLLKTFARRFFDFDALHLHFLQQQNFSSAGLKRTNIAYKNLSTTNKIKYSNKKDHV